MFSDSRIKFKTTTTTTKTPTVYGISLLKTVRAGSKVFVIDIFPLYVIFLHAAASFAVITFKLLSRFQHYSNTNFWYERNTRYALFAYVLMVPKVRSYIHM